MQNTALELLLSKLAANDDSIVSDGARIKMIYKGEGKIVKTTEDKPTKVNPKFAHLATNFRVLSIVKNGDTKQVGEGVFRVTNTASYTKVIFERDVPFLWDTIDKAEAYGIEKNNGVFPEVEMADIEIWEGTTDREYLVIDAEGNYMKDGKGNNVTSRKISFVVFPSSKDNAQSELRSTMRRLSEQYTTDAKEIGVTAQGEGDETAEKKDKK